MKNLKLFKLFLVGIGLLITSLTTVAKADDINYSGGMIYFADIYDINAGYIQLCGRQSSWTGISTMSNIGNTKLYYVKDPQGSGWGGILGWRVVSDDEERSNQNWDTWSAASWYSAWNTYGFNSGSTYLIIPSSADNDASTTNSCPSGYSALNHSQTVHRYTCVNGYNFTAAEVNSGTVTISAYKMTDNGTASNTSNSATINTAATTSVNVDAAYTGEVTVTATAATGYVFLGWYNGSGTLVASSTSYTYNAPNEDYDVYARFAPKYTVGNTLYLATNDDWEKYTQEFVAVFGNNTSQTWVKCSTVESRIYSVTVPSGNWGYVIMCRRGVGAEDGFENIWDQTSDMMVYGTFNSIAINGNGSYHQEWSRYAPTPALSGDFNDWSADADVFDANGEVSVALDANSAYEIKVVSGTTWYGIDNTKVYGQEDTYTLVGAQASIKLHTASIDGTYKFTWDAANSELSIEYPDVPHPNAGYVYFLNDQSWNPVAIHVWGGTEGYGTTWGSNPAISSFNWDGTDYYYAAMGNHTSVIFGQGIDNDHKTDDLSKNDGLGKYYKKSKTAGWYDFTATLTLATNQGETTNPSPTSVTVTYGASTNINTDIISTSPAKTGYTFGGYYTEVGGGGTQVITAAENIPSALAGYTAGGKWIKTGSSVSATLYAKWTETVTLNNQGADAGKGGTANFTATYNSSTGLTTITKPQKTGYIFSGYYTLSYGSGKQIIDADGNFNTSVSGFITDGKWTRPAGSAVTLYAYWKKECSASSYTLRYFNTGTVAYNSACFSQVGETHEWNITNFAIPSETNYSVGYNEDVYESDLGSANSSSVSKAWTDTYSDGNGAMQLLPAGASARAVGQATGAVGKLVIWDNSPDKNLSVGFLPNGYGVTTADNTYAFTLGDGNFCYTDPVTISSTEAAGNFQVKLATSSSYAACAQGTAEAASAVNGRKISGDANIANGKKGVFQMWRDATANNFGLRFVTVYDVTFDMQGHGSAISTYENVRYNDMIGAPDAPSQTGYTFGGWYKDEDCTDDWDFATDVVTENTTLYAKWTPVTLTFVGISEGGEWNCVDNWSPACIPTIEHDVVLEKNAVLYGRFGGVSGHGRAKSIKIDKSVEARKNIRLSIWTCSSLIVAEDIKAKHMGDADYGAVNAEDLYIETTVLGNGVLICGSANANTAATYDFHSKAYKADSKWYINQYVGIPFAELDADKMRGFNIFVYDDAEDDWRTPGSNTMNPWTAYDLLCIYPGGVGNQELKGTLLFPGTGVGTTKTLSCTRRNSEDDKWNEVTHPFPESIDGKDGHQDHMFANSWTAPIEIAAMEESDFTHLVHTIYIFNAGYEGEGGREIGDYAGQWSSFPLASVKSGLIENAVIPATQAFLVTDTASGSSITLDYKNHVYEPAKATSDANDTINNFPTRAPRRVKKSSSLNSLTMLVRSEEDVIADRLYIIEGNNLRTDTFDNGWDGNKIMGESFAPQLYAMSDGSKMAVNAVKDMEGMKIGFKAGTSAQDYTLSFDYEEQAEPLYLYDTDTETYTEITSDATYSFTTSDRKAHERFLLTRSNAPQIATGVEEIDTEKVQRAQKFMQDQQIFIRRGERVYNVTGSLVK